MAHSSVDSYGGLPPPRELEGRAALLQGSRDAGHLTSQLRSVGSRQGWWLCHGQNSRCPFVGMHWLGDIFWEATVAPVGPIWRHPELRGTPAGLLSMAPIGGLLEMCILTVWGLCCLDRAGSHITDRAGKRFVRAPMDNRGADEEAPQSSRAQDSNRGAAPPNSA